MIRIFVCLIKLFLLCFLLTGCITPYQRMSWGYGYSDIALAPDIYKVIFKGNAATSSDTVQNYALRRCAEIAFREGYSYFIILSGNTSVARSYYSTPTTIQSRSYGNSSAYGNAYGNPGYTNYTLNGSSYGNVNTTINPGVTNELNQYGAVLVIKLLKSNKHIPIALSAQIILNNYASIAQ